MELQAGGNLTLEAGKAYAGDQYALSHRERSLVSRSSTETRSDEQHEVILGSALSGKSLMAKAGNDLTLRGTSMAADGDIRLQAGGDLSLDTVDQKDISEVYQKTKRKGLMGAGMGILIGSEKKSGQVQQETHTVEINGTRASGSQVQAGGNVTLKAGGKDILLKGSQVSGQNVELSAGENILLQAGKNQETIQEKDSAKGGNVGISMGRTGLVGISAEGGMVKGTSQEEKRYYTNAAVQADRKLTFTTGKDIHIAGGTLSGESVNGQVSGNLQLDSLQDTHTYTVLPWK